jgi:hypothetical protein
MRDLSTTEEAALASAEDLSRLAASRERDARGRPLNARPRDGLGRPLPRGEAGVPRVPDNLVLPPEQSLTEAQRLLDDGQPFHAHEVLEGTWKAAPEDERELWQGLAQLAVGLTHVLRGNDTGAVAVLTRGRDRVKGYAENPPYQIDATGVIAWSDALLQELGEHNKEHPGATTVARLRLTTATN